MAPHTWGAMLTKANWQSVAVSVFFPLLISSPELAKLSWDSLLLCKALQRSFSLIRPKNFIDFFDKYLKIVAHFYVLRPLDGYIRDVEELSTFFLFTVRFLPRPHGTVIGTSMLLVHRWWPPPDVSAFFFFFFFFFCASSWFTGCYLPYIMFSFLPTLGLVPS